MILQIMVVTTYYMYLYMKDMGRVREVETFLLFLIEK